MSDSAVDKATFAFLASCVGDFIRWPQCKSADLWGDNNDGRFSRARFEARAMNPDDRTVFRIIVTKGDDWRVRVIQVSNHVLLDENGADRDFVVHAVNRFRELAGMVESAES